MPVLALALVTGISLVFACAVLPSWAALAGIGAVGSAFWAGGLRPPAMLAAGIVLAAVQGHRVTAEDWPCQRDRELVDLGGTVVAPPELREERVDFELATDRDARARGVPPRIRLSWYEPTASPRPGDTWQLSARLRCRGGFANPGGFDRELDLLRRGLGATGYVSGPMPPRLLARDSFNAPVAAARHWVAGRIARHAAGTRSAGVLQGLAVGLRGNIAPDIHDAIVTTGTAHLIAISGLHVTAFAAVALFLLRFLYRFTARPAWSARWPAAQAGLVLALTVAYGLLAGASLPTVRTVGMVGVALALKTVRRRAAASDVLAMTALLLLAMDPLAATSAGFWLSFAAVGALLALVDLSGGLAGTIRTFVQAQAAVAVVLAPVLVGTFGALPLLGPAINAVAIPFFSIVLLPATLAAMALLPLAPDAAGLLWSGLGNLLDRCWPLLERAAEWPGSLLTPPAAPPWLLFAGTAAGMAAVMAPGRSLKLLAGVLLAAILLRPATGTMPGAFELSVLDVGHGLATVVRTENRVIVFDTGPGWRGGGSAARVTVTPFLRSLGVRTIDLVVVSHADADHAGGLEELRRTFDVRRVIGDLQLRQGSADGPCVAGQSWKWDGVGFSVLHPRGGEAYGDNDRSCALAIRGPGGSALLLADPEGRAERAMLDAGGLSADVVLVPHHGSATSSSAGLVAAVGARLALVSTDFGNRWGLPRPEVVARWQDGGAQVLSTAGSGALGVTVSPAGGVGPVTAHRRSEPRWWRRRE